MNSQTFIGWTLERAQSVLFIKLDLRKFTNSKSPYRKNVNQGDHWIVTNFCIFANSFEVCNELKINSIIRKNKALMGIRIEKMISLKMIFEDSTKFRIKVLCHSPNFCLKSNPGLGNTIKKFSVRILPNKSYILKFNASLNGRFGFPTDWIPTPIWEPWRPKGLNRPFTLPDPSSLKWESLKICQYTRNFLLFAT